MVQALSTFEGITTSQPQGLDLLTKSVELAAALHEASRPALRAFPLAPQVERLALLSAIHTVNSLLAVASAQCSLSPPPASIDMVTDASGELIYRCEHPDPHRWSLDGARLP